MIRAVFLDLSGVLYDGDTLIPGALEAVRQLQDSPLHIRFVTNTSRKPRQVLLADLRRFGFAVDSAGLFTAVDAARGWLREHGRRPHCLVHANIRGEFADFDQRDPDAVLVGDAEDGFTYAAMNEAFRLCVQGAPLLGVGYNRYFKSDGRLWLDAGPFVRALEFAAGVEALIVGKPAAGFFHQVLASAGVAAGEALMVGDDVFGDVEGALGAGLAACLVRTGKYRAGDEGKVPGDYPVVDSIVEAAALALGGAA